MVFPFFYVFAVSIVFELVKAFTIEIFMKLKKKPAEAVKFEALEDLKDIFDEDGKVLHYRLFGDESLQEKMVEALDKLEQFAEGEEDSSSADSNENAHDRHLHHLSAMEKGNE